MFHVTADESGQIVGVIKEDDVSFMDFSYSLPEGYGIESNQMVVLSHLPRKAR